MNNLLSAVGQWVSSISREQFALIFTGLIAVTNALTFYLTRRDKRRERLREDWPTWRFDHDGGRVYVLSLSGSDAFDVELWSTPPGQLELWGGAEDDDGGTIRFPHFPVGRRESFFVPHEMTRIHVSWKPSERSRNREQRDLY